MCLPQNGRQQAEVNQSNRSMELIRYCLNNFALLSAKILREIFCWREEKISESFQTKRIRYPRVLRKFSDRKVIHSRELGVTIKIS